MSRIFHLRFGILCNWRFGATMGGSKPMFPLGRFAVAFPPNRKSQI